MNSSFRRAAYSSSSFSKTSIKIWFLNKVSAVLLTANFLLIILASRCWLLLKDFKQEQWLVPFVEDAVKSAPKTYWESSHTSKTELLRKKLTALTHILPWWNFFTKCCCQKRFLTKWIYLVLFLKKNQIWSKNPRISFRQFKLTLAKGRYRFLFS